MTHTTPPPATGAGTGTVGPLAALLEEYRVSIPELAEHIGKDRTHLWRVLNGHAPASHDMIARSLIGLGEIVQARGGRS